MLESLLNVNNTPIYFAINNNSKVLKAADFFNQIWAFKPLRANNSSLIDFIQRSFLSNSLLAYKFTCLNWHNMKKIVAEKTNSYSFLPRKTLYPPQIILVRDITHI